MVQPDNAAPPLPRLLPCGDGAVTVEFGDRIDPQINARVIALDRAMSSARLPGVIETVPTYRSLLIQFDPTVVEYAALGDAVLALSRRPAAGGGTSRRWKIPVVYGGAFGIDLEVLAARHGMGPDELVALHAGPVYTIFMIGFMPGFAYLGGLDARLATPRLERPRSRIPSQSISIGGEQTAIGTVECPSGWHLIGRTPARPFMPGRDPVFLYTAGDEIVFEPVPESAWPGLDAAAARGESVATCEPA